MTRQATADPAEHDLQHGATAQPAPLPLRRNLRFQALWLGQTASTLGVAVADVAYPLAILAITGSPARAGLFAAVQATGSLLAGLPAGWLADRYSQRLLVIIAETCRAAITCLVVAGLISGWLSLPLLLCAAALLGMGAAICGPARLLLVRSVVPPEQLTKALTQDEVRQNGSALAGPALGGALYGISALAHAIPFLCTAASFAISLLTTTLVRVRPAKPGPPPAAAAGSAADAGWRQIFSGVSTLWREPVLRAAVLLIMMINTVGAGLDLVIIVILRQQGVHSGEIGLALGCGAAGGLAGAPLVKILHRLRPGVLLLSVTMLLIPIFALLALPLGPWWVAGLLFTGMLGTPAARVLIDILLLRQAPAEQRGRVVAALMTLFGLGMPAGLLGCGLLLQYLPAQAAMLTLAAVLAVGIGYSATRRELWAARWPQAR